MITLNRNIPVMVAVSVLTLLGACATPGPGDVGEDGVFDPYEKNNRAVHEFNLEVDEFLFRPAATQFTRIVPDPVENMLLNFSDNLSEPGDAVNFLAQGQIGDAAISVGRFGFNTVFGFLGIFDAASEFNIPRTDTDFGETLHVWGVPEGAYVELPIFGPSTQRDAAGIFVDFFTNPLRLAPQNPVDDIGIYAKATEALTERGRFVDTIDSILYESADSYAQSRLIYLQTRRFELGEADAAAYIDPYMDP
ncbi:MAG: VacJ family lipoprotein [Rhodobacteraceae bacterium]|nr:VacJ family lipoprotein [Paracoccaceae bacterium]